MSNTDKLISRLENNPNNASFDDLKRILEYFGWELRSVRGSHHKFYKQGSKPIIIPFHKPIKACYTQMIIKAIKEQNERFSLLYELTL